jgi:hypothetical protein
MLQNNSPSRGANQIRKFLGKVYLGGWTGTFSVNAYKQPFEGVCSSWPSNTIPYGENWFGTVVFPTDVKYYYNTSKLQAILVDYPNPLQTSTGAKYYQAFLMPYINKMYVAKDSSTCKKESLTYLTNLWGNTYSWRIAVEAVKSNKLLIETLAKGALIPGYSLENVRILPKEPYNVVADLWKD